MKQYNFDEEVDRTNTSAYKWVLMEKFFGTNEGIPLWVADMDFRTPDVILEAIEEICRKGVLGYTLPSDTYTQSIANWLVYKHQWTVKQDAISFTPGVLTGLAMAIQAFSNKGDKILVQPPIYPPFLSLPEEHDRELVINALQFDGKQFDIDFEDFEQKLASGVKLFILCHPHNPGGRVWMTEELRRMADLCIKYNTLIISDEIHADLMLWGKQHTPIAKLSDAIAQHTITFMAPSKTFNIPGLASAFFVAENPALFSGMQREINRFHVKNGNVFGCLATEVAYNKGKEWLPQAVSYIENNILFVRDFFAQHIPSIQVVVPEASFLIWLDCRQLGMTSSELKDFMVHKAKVIMNDGATFGQGGEGFQRINVACPRSVLEKALYQIKQAIDTK
ncbi:MAG: PatB family C-S lyase [Paludibacteraceae bacterium]|nr:PatB family C-S lyase [Paludibacteraceae bacterium]MBP6283945.1 PatB family C-S lyase [Paludibacteraceae bacterium]